MEEEKVEPIQAPLEPAKPEKPVKPIKPEVDLKKELKALKLENSELQAKLNAAQNIIDGLKQKNDQTEKYADNLALEYNRITRYIMDATNVFYKGIAMAIKKEDN